MVLDKFIQGYIFSTFIGWFILFIIIDVILWRFMYGKWRHEELGGNFVKTSLPTWILGIIERFIYTFVFLNNIPYWIPVWLGLKTAAQWSRWSDTATRATYYIFLIGNAISLIISFLAAWYILGKNPL